jgi:hypothetical protein
MFNFSVSSDLAIFYDVKPIRLGEQVKKKYLSFSCGFHVTASEDAVEFMVSQNAIPSKQHLGKKVVCLRKK